MASLSLPTPPLRDATVLLRPWSEDDVPALAAGFGDPSVLRFSWPYEDPYTEDEARAYLEHQERGRRLGGELHFAVVAPREPTVALGGGSLSDIELRLGRATIGYWLAPAARGRGLATNAVRLCAAWAFADLGLARLAATCGPDNQASQRVLERCGFVREALLRSHMAFKGGRRDSVVFGLLPGELR